MNRKVPIFVAAITGVVGFVAGYLIADTSSNKITCTEACCSKDEDDGDDFDDFDD